MNNSELVVDLTDYKQTLDTNPELSLEGVLSKILSEKLNKEVIVHEGCKYSFIDSRFHITSATITFRS